MEKVRPCRGNALPYYGWSENSNSSTLALVPGINHLAVLSVTSWAVLVSHCLDNAGLHSLTWGESRQAWKEITFVRKGAHIREWGSTHGCLGNRFPPVTRNQFSSGKAIQQRKRVLWAEMSPSITGKSNTSWGPGWPWCCSRVQGSKVVLAWVPSEVSFWHDSLWSCDLTSILKHSISKQGPDHLQLYSERFPGMISP